MWCISAANDLTQITTREILMPPPVEPAQLPMSMSSSSTSWESTGHWAKSTVAKPVVEMMELT